MSDNILRSHLESEVLKMYKDRRNGLILGVVLVVVVFGYMSFISSKWDYVTQPQNLAQFSAGVVLDNLPALRSGAEEMLSKQAPALATYVGDSVTNEVPKLVSGMVGSMVTQYTGKLAGYAVNKYSEAFKAVIDSAKADIAKAVKTDNNEEQERAVVAALEKQMEALGKRVDDGELNKDPLFKQIEESHVALAQLNDRLKAVTSKKDSKLNRKDKLTKRFLGTFWRFVQQENPDVVVPADDKGGKKKAGKKAAKKAKK